MKKFEILKLLDEYAAQSNCKKKGVASILLKDGEPVNYGINEVMLPTTKRNCELCEHVNTRMSLVCVLLFMQKLLA